MSDQNDTSKEKSKIQLPLLPTGKPNISFSELSEWRTCSWKHHLHHVKKIDLQKPGPALVFGTAIHSACEHYLRTRVMDPSITINAINQGWDKYKEHEDFHNNKEEYLRQAEEILAEVPSFLDESFPNWEYVDAEHQLFETLESSLGAFKFKGFIDGIIRCDPKRGKKKITWLIDWKTSTIGWLKDKRQDPMLRNQLILYKNFWVKKTGDQPKDVRCTFVILKRMAKKGKHCERFDVSVGGVSQDRAVGLTRDMLTSMNKGIKIKNRYSCKWCEYRETEHCDSWAKLW